MSDKDKEVIKKKIQELAHTKQFHDKEVDYIIFKNKDVLSKIISPKKPGLVPKGRKANEVEKTSTFDPNADYSKMTPTQREEWEKGYKEATEFGDGLITDKDGKKTLV